MNKDLEDLMRNPTIPVDTAARVLGVSRGSAYTAVKEGALESIAVGKRRLVLTAPLRRKLGLVETA